MDIFIDTETQGLDTSKFIMGVMIYKKNKKKQTETYYTKQEFWNRIKELAQIECDKGKNTNLIFFAKSEYDFYATIPDTADQKLKYIGGKGTIAEYNLTPNKPNSKDKKEYKDKKIHIIDMANITGGNLKALGEKIGLNKLEMPERLKQQKTKRGYTQEELGEIQIYCERDADIVFEAYNKIKQEFREINLRPARLNSCALMTLRFLKKHIETKEYKDKLLEADEQQDRNSSKGRKALMRIIPPLIIRNKRIIEKKLFQIYAIKKRNKKGDKEIIEKIKESIKRIEEINKAYTKVNPHNCYRGARIQALKKGQYENVYSYDVNNMYSYCATKTEIPDLSSERIYTNPLKTMPLDYILNRYGCSRAVIETKEDKIGLIPIRQEGRIYYPKEAGKILIGTWTNYELKYFKEQGNKILHIETSLIYDTIKENPIKEVMETYYKRRQLNPLNKTIYKQMANYLIGTLGRTTKGNEYIIAPQEETDKLRTQGWKIKHLVKAGLIRFVRKLEKKPSKDYCPIIPAHIVAMSRIILYKKMLEIENEHPNAVLYCDTDAIKTQGEYNKYFNISDKLGDYKIEYEKTNIEIICEKNYLIGETLKIAGATIKGTNNEAIKEWKEKRQISHTQLITIKSAQKSSEIGKMRTNTRDLNQMAEESKIKELILRQKPYYIDEDEQNNALDYETLQIIKGIRNKECLNTT